MCCRQPRRSSARFSKASSGAISQEPPLRGSSRRSGSSIASCSAEGMTRGDPVQAIEGPKLGRTLPKLISNEDVDKLLATAKDAADRARGSARFRAFRLYCLLEVLYASGMRVSELVSLPASAATGEERFLTVRGKGGRERLVPLNDRAHAALGSLLRHGTQDPERPSGQVSVCFARPVRASHTPAFCPGAQVARGQGRSRRSKNFAPCAQACIRVASAGGGCGFARCPADAGACRHLDDADLYPRSGRAAEGHRGNAPSACQTAGPVGWPRLTRWPALGTLPAIPSALCSDASNARIP